MSSLLTSVDDDHLALDIKPLIVFRLLSMVLRNYNLSYDSIGSSGYTPLNYVNLFFAVPGKISRFFYRLDEFEPSIVTTPLLESKTCPVIGLAICGVAVEFSFDSEPV